MTNKKEKRYCGFFLLDSGVKIQFDISEEHGGEKFEEMCWSSEFPYEKGDVIWLGESNDYSLLADRVAGFHVEDYEE